jgi:hypothetical protein
MLQEKQQAAARGKLHELRQQQLPSPVRVWQTARRRHGNGHDNNTASSTQLCATNTATFETTTARSVARTTTT